MRVNYSKAKDLFGFKYAFYKHTRLSVLEKIKNKKKIFREQFYSKAKIFRKKFFYKKIEKRQRSSWCPNRGCVPSAHKAAQYRHVTDVTHLYCVRVPCIPCRSACVPSVLLIFKGARYFRGLFLKKIMATDIRLKTAFMTKNKTRPS